MAFEWGSWRFTPGGDRRFYAYVLKHNGTPIWVGMGTGIRHESGAIAVPPRSLPPSANTILRNLSEITSEIVLADLPWAEAAEKESALIEEHGLICDGTGTLFNRTYGAACRERVAVGAIAETVAKRRAESTKRPRVLNLDEAAKQYSTTRRNIECLEADGRSRN